MEDSRVDLREYLEREIARLEQVIQAKMDAQEKALGVAQATLRDRFASVNEFRAALSDLTNAFEPRAVIDAKFKSLENKMSALEKQQANINGRIIGYSAGIGGMVLVISIVLQLINFGA